MTHWRENRRGRKPLHAPGIHEEGDHDLIDHHPLAYLAKRPTAFQYLVVFGPAGVGKGEIAIRTGVAVPTRRHFEMSQFIPRQTDGTNTSDDVVIPAFEINFEAYTRGSEPVLVDGIPRSTEQARAFAAYFERMRITQKVILANLQVIPEVAVDRQVKRAEAERAKPVDQRKRGEVLPDNDDELRALCEGRVQRHLQVSDQILRVLGDVFPIVPIDANQPPERVVHDVLARSGWRHFCPVPHGAVRSADGLPRLVRDCA